MDFHALQHKLFALDPVDPKEDLARLRGQAQGAAQAPVESSVDYLQESASVPEGSLQMDRDYSVNDFAALAGIVNEAQKDGDYVKGSDPMPAAEPGRTKHPHEERLVGSIQYEDDDRISALERRIEALEAMLNEKAVSKQQQKFFGVVRSMQKGDTPPEGEAGEVAKDMSKADVKKMASTKHKGLPTRAENIDTSDIKTRLYDALNKKMGL